MSSGSQRATAAHIDVLTAIHAASFPPRERWKEDAFALQLVMPGVFGLVHPDGGLLMARVAADQAEILTLAVIPEARRNGIARALLTDAMAIARKDGARSMFLEVAVGNVPALRLYREAGFAEVGRRPRYYANGGDALVLRVGLA